jgi:hypothetical protein
MTNYTVKVTRFATIYRYGTQMGQRWDKNGPKSDTKKPNTGSGFRNLLSSKYKFW